MPRWRSDQKELYYLTPGGGIMAVEVSTEPAFHAGDPALMIQTPLGFIRGNAPGSLADVRPDGKEFLLAMPIEHSATDDALTVVLNWQASLTK